MINLNHAKMIIQKYFNKVKTKWEEDMFELAIFDNKKPEDAAKKPKQQKADEKEKENPNNNKYSVNNPPMFKPMMSNFNTIGNYVMNGMNGMNCMNPMMNRMNQMNPNMMAFMTNMMNQMNMMNMQNQFSQI